MYVWMRRREGEDKSCS